MQRRFTTYDLTNSLTCFTHFEAKLFEIVRRMFITNSTFAFRRYVNIVFKEKKGAQIYWQLEKMVRKTKKKINYCLLLILIKYSERRKNFG